MKIVVLDGHTLNPGDLSWEPLESLGELTVHERTPPEQVVERAAGAEAVLTNKVRLDEAILGRLPDLRYLGVLATGVNVVDLEAARHRRVPVTNVPAYSTASVAQMVFAHLLHHTQGVARHDRLVRQGRWAEGPDFCFWEGELTELEGLALGIVGFGRIGRRVAALGRAFGMRRLVHTAHPGRHRDDPEAAGVRFVEREELFRRSDVITLHCPLTPETEGLVNAERIGLMKRTALLINTGRGRLVDEAALAAALAEGRIAGAGLDVLAAEPPSPENPLLDAPRSSLTPHIAWATRAARERLMTTAAANLKAFLEGRPRNVVT